MRIYNPTPDEPLDIIARANRICVVGCHGSGKSTLSTLLAARFDKPLVRLDDLYWLPDWRRPDLDTWFKVVESEIGRPAWIMDGNHIQTLALRLRRADLTIYLDLGTLRCLLRVLKRDLRRALWDRSDLPKQLRAATSFGHHLDFWRRTLAFRTDVRPKVIKLFEAHRGDVVCFTEHHVVQRLIDAMTDG